MPYSDPRAAVSFSELDVRSATFKFDGTIVPDPNRYDLGQGSTQVGAAVVLSADSTVGLGASGGWPLGKLLKVGTDGFASVARQGVVALPYVAANANPPIVGRGVQVDGAGNVISPAGGVRLATERGTVLSLDSVNQLAYVDLG